MQARPDNGTSRIRERLLSDHKRLEKLLADMLIAFEENDREAVAALWTEFEKHLLAHLEVEERHLIPLLLRTNERAARTIAREHKHIRDRLMDLGTAVDLHVVRIGMARDFIHELGAHAESEDTLLYQWADEHVDEGIRKTLLKDLAEALKAPFRARGSRTR